MKYIHLIVCALGIGIQAEVSDVVIFSYDRPLQLYALLESIHTYVKGVGHITVMYRSSNEEYTKGFEQVGQEFPEVRFLKQGENPHQDFKPLTLKAIFDSPAPYILFAVDDIVVKDYIDLSYCIELLERTNAYGFYLRLGKNLNYCYTMSHSQQVPPLFQIENDVYAWTFNQGEYDWNYPNTVDMTLYRKKEIEAPFRSLTYKAPNTLEGQWSTTARTMMKRKGLCFNYSKMVNLPLNRVQDEWNNKSMEITPAHLLELFEQGLKLDIKPLFCINNSAAHMEYEPTFIIR